MEARKELLSLYPPPLPTATTPDSVALNQARDRENANAGSGCVSGPSLSTFGSSSTSASGSSSLPSSQTNASSALPSDNQRSSHPLLPTIKSPKALPFPRTSMDDRKMKIVQFPAGLSLDSQVLDLVEGGMGPLGASSSGTPAAAGFFGGMMGGMMGGVVGGWAIGSLSGVGGLTPTNYYYANGYGDVDYGKEGGKGGKDGARDGHAHPHTQGGHVNVRGPHGYGCTCANRGRGGRGGEKTGVNGEKREKTREEKERADRAWNRQKDLEKLRATPGVMYPGWERYVVKRVD
ncbi:hypothetical protein K435DRAFT_46251 [Dendrothele bispora CBS 962.96]|uniref:Uncharacterized protein n=1 Tax=Dendrothele bispora (strain CBS 962.96) TaxID=1314807 RepID=A0A4S8KSR7_DENBC|nr:hypothetical protein K435DRAFT_46251 [Dendrothele bispora CBS 962.96]